MLAEEVNMSQHGENQMCCSHHSWHSSLSTFHQDPQALPNMMTSRSCQLNNLCQMHWFSSRYKTRRRIQNCWWISITRWDPRRIQDIGWMGMETDRWMATYFPLSIFQKKTNFRIKEIGYDIFLPLMDPPKENPDQFYTNILSTLRAKKLMSRATM